MSVFLGDETGHVEKSNPHSELRSTNMFLDMRLAQICALIGD
jgi:hypothetical protein